jgi:hypothetical protein
MRSHWLLSEFLDQYVDESIEYPRSIKELSIFHHCVIRLFRVYVVDERKRKVLVDCNEIDLVLQDLFFRLSIAHPPNLSVVDFSILW